MNKLFAFVAMIALCALVVAPVMAKPPHMATMQAGKSNVAHTNLMSDEGDESPWGMVKHNVEGETFDYVLNAHGLEPMTEYVVKSLGHELGMGMTDEEGNLHISDSWDCTEDLNPARINVRRADKNERVMYSNEDAHEIFTCVE